MAKKEQENVMATPAVPLGYRQLGTQVAGHTFEASNAAAVGLLQDAGEGCVFKPLGKPECGVREVTFYDSLRVAQRVLAGSAGASAPAANDLNGKGDAAEAQQQQQDDAEVARVLSALAAHVPRYYGQVKLVVNQREHTFIKLQDLTHNMKRPCVMDIKVGRRTWDPLSSPHKRAIEEQKYVICKQNLGLCLPGFQVYQPGKEGPRLLRHGRDYGKKLDVEGFRQTLATFFNINNCSSECSQILLEEVLRQLRSILAWFKRQRLLHFFASSLLICYDYDQLLQCNNYSPMQLNGFHEKPFPPTTPDEWINVRCIDFAHVFASEDGEPDHNYMFGLQSLIDIVESMLQR